MIRVRFAPSPTGFLHIGGLRTALYDDLFAQHHGGAFVLRIEDTDRGRYVEGAVESLLRTLQRCGIKITEGPYLDEQGNIQERGDYGPYVQSQRLELYHDHAEKLIASGHAYRCFCTSERLEEMRQGQVAAKLPVMYDKRCRVMSAAETEAEMAKGTPHVVRMKMPVEGVTAFTDLVRGAVEFENALIDDQVLMKTDGYATYHLANVVDDHLMQISHVFRAEEWLPSTPKHLVLYHMFGWKPPEFGHLPLLLNADRSKLSKRQGDVAAEDYLEKGYLPEALINFVALMGWNPSGDREVYSKEELVSLFTIDRVNKSGAVFNVEKLDWFNKEYLRILTPAALAAAAQPFYAAAGITADLAQLEKAVALEQRRVATLAEFPEATRFLFEDAVIVDVAMLPGKKGTPEIALNRLSGLLEFLGGAGEELFADPKALEQATLAHIVEKGWTNAETLWPLRVSLSGRAASPGPFEIAWALGKERALARIQHAITLLS